MSDTPPESTRWYYRSRSLEAGPITFGELRARLRRGQLAKNADVRRADSAVWVKASIVVEHDLPTAETASRQLPQARTSEALQSRLVREHSTRSEPVGRRLGSPAPRAKGNQPQRASRSDRIVLAICMVVLLVNTVIILKPPRDVDRDYFDHFIRMHAELVAHRENRTSESDWQAWAETTREHVASIVADLQESATVRSRAKLHLLNAGRDYLPKMLRQSSLTVTREEELFLRHIGEVRRILGLPNDYNVAAAGESSGGW